MSETLLRLIELALQEEHEKYLHIQKLSEQQIALLEEDSPDTERIAQLMNLKITLIDEIQELEKNHDPVKEQWKKEFSHYTKEERKTIKTIRQQCMDTIQGLHDLESQIAQHIQRCSTDIQQQLSNLQKGRSVNQAYFSYEKMPPQYIDKKK